MDGSNGGRVPGLDCFLRELCVLVPRDILGKVGCCFLLREEEEILDDSYFMVMVVLESLDDSVRGVLARESAFGNEGTGGGGGREYLGGVEAGR